MSDPLYCGIDHNRQSANTSKMLSPELLQRVITDITGFHPKAEGIDIMRASGEGESAGELVVSEFYRRNVGIFGRLSVPNS